MESTNISQGSKHTTIIFSAPPPWFFASNASSSNVHSSNKNNSNSIHKHNNGERHIYQICDKVGYQAVYYFVLRDLLNKTYKDIKVSYNSPTAYTTNIGSSSPPENVWLLDIGVNHHLASNPSNVPNSTLYNGYDGISLSNGNVLPIHYVDNDNLSSS